MIRVNEISFETRKKLERMKREEPGHIAFRAYAVMLSHDRGLSAKEIADLLEWKVKRVRRWLKRFNEKGTDGLYDHYRSGRESKAKQEILDEIIKKLEEGHPPEETKQSIWTINLLLNFLKICFKIELHPDTLRGWVHSLGFSWKRAKLSPAPTEDPKALEKLQRISQVIENKKPTDNIVYQDESTFYLLPILRSMWSRVGEQFKVLTYSSWNKNFKVFGAVNKYSGKFTYQTFDKCNGENFIEFLKTTLKDYPIGMVYMILDNASFHKSKLVKAWLEQNPRIELLFLPTRSPRLNPVEKVWWYVKPKVYANKWLGDIDFLKEKTLEILENFTNEKILKLTHLAA